MVPIFVGHPVYEICTSSFRSIANWGFVFIWGINLDGRSR